MLQLTEDNYEQIVGHCVTDISSAIDLTNAAFIDPYGMVGLLEMGEFFKLKGIRKILHLPQSEDVLKYLERMDFFRFAGEYFELVPARPNPSEKYLRSPNPDVLLEITPIEKFEHSENKGFVGIQKYHFNNIGRNVVKIAVMDLGIGFRKSLSQRFSLKDDFQAIEKALLHGASRYVDEGRGHGLAAVKRLVSQWNGKLSIRSGTAKLSIIPDWSWGKEKEINLPLFPGSQINIMLPEI
ncbi:MAG: sensor histidine kinase [Deltaproteobacteria bacterium]|nr:sensor histidine kinase [Deltaproteobacteria bacterium]